MVEKTEEVMPRKEKIECHLMTVLRQLKVWEVEHTDFVFGGSQRKN